MSGDDDIFIASSLIADTPEKEKENATPSETPVMIQRSGDKGPRSGRKSLLGRRRSSIGRRLSGFGGGGFDANTDQGKLKSMYSSIIKLNSENKITRDKCWGLHLIDYMDKVILDEGGQAGGAKVNFQKASCTLDASVKIYSHRVDATHMSSYSLLENLSRTDGDKAVKGSGASVGSSERSAKLGVHETLKKASQLNQSEMDRAFEVDPMFHKMSKIFDEAGSKGMLLNNLNVGDGCKVSFESEVKTASDSPEENNTEKPGQSEANENNAGSGSTWANEERNEDDTLNDERCGGIHAASKNDAETSTKRPGGMVDVSGLRVKLSELCDDLTTLSLCPQLQDLRDLISVLDGSVILPSREAVMATATETAVSDVDGGDVGSESDGDNGGVFDDLPDGDNASFDRGTGGEDNGTEQIEADPFVADTGECLADPPVSFGAEGVSPFAAGDLSMIGFEGGLDGETMGSSKGAVVRPTSIEGRLCDDLKIVNDDYSFYEYGALAAAAAACANNWAGASHWKFVGVKKKLTRPKRERNTLVGDDTEAIVEDDDGEDNNGRKTRGKRKLPAIDFDSTAVPLAALSAPKAVASRSRRGKKPIDKTLLSQDYVSRAKKDVEEGTSRYVLPENAGFKPRDLAELFLRPGAITKRWAASEADTGVGQSQRYTRGFVDGSPTAGGFFVEGNDDLLFADENGDYGGEIGGGGDDDDDGDDNNGIQGFHFDGEENAMENKGVLGEDGVFVDDFQAEGLLSAERRVEKIDVAYARKAKKVDVRRLKGDLWRKIDSFVSTKQEKIEPETESDVDVPTHPEGNDNGDESQSKPPEVVDMTFSDIVLDVSSTEEQSGVTVPFYFICVLHLANEKGLKLEGRDDLLDFSVSSDYFG